MLVLMDCLSHEPHTFSPVISPPLHSSMSRALPAYGNLLCLEYRPASSSLLMKSFRKCLEMPDFGQMSHSVIQALYIARVSFGMSSVIRK